MKLVILGLSITSSWGNGHATTYRGLVRELVRRGHDMLFLERNQPWYEANRDLPNPSFGRTEIYRSVRQLKSQFADEVAEADCVIVGSFVPGGIAIGEWVTQTASGVTAFYDIDTPITLTKIAHGDCDYLSASLISRYDVYLSFTGGPTLELLEAEYGSPMARALYCSVDPELYYPEKRARRWSLGYLGTFSQDRQSALNELLLDPATNWPAGCFVVAGPQYPRTIKWPPNVDRVVHLNPKEHRAFYNSQRFTLNITRADMVRAGFSPSVRLFEAAACGTPILTDAWAGLETIFEPGCEIIVVKTGADVLAILHDLPESTAREIANRARDCVLAAHTAEHRAAEMERIIADAGASGASQTEPLVPAEIEREEVSP
jgi:spore maturation protein CgeB